MKNGRLGEVVADLHWYALLVPPQKEFVAQEILRRKGMVTFVPFTAEWRYKSRYTREKELKSYPVMPRYLFAGFVPGVPLWFNIFAIHVISGVVGLHGEPKRVHGVPELISRMKNGLRRPNEERFMRTHKEYKVGDLANIVSSPFAGLVVTVSDIREGHAFFTLDMFGAERTISLPLDKLEAA